MHEDQTHAMANQMDAVVRCEGMAASMCVHIARVAPKSEKIQARARMDGSIRKEK